MTDSVVPPEALRIAVILPVLNEGRELKSRLEDLDTRSGIDEIIIVDGGSTDDSQAIVREWLVQRPASAAAASARLIVSERGRARQMNTGADAARADVLLFLHADTRPPPDAVERIRAAIAHGAVWGRFDVRLDAGGFLFRAIEFLMNVRSAVTGVATGDQAMFVRRDAFAMLGGFPPQDLMEDIELSRRLQWVARPARIRAPVVASARRWRRRGVFRTILLMWLLRFLYWAGVSPARLARWYR